MASSGGRPYHNQHQQQAGDASIRTESEYDSEEYEEYLENDYVGRPRNDDDYTEESESYYTEDGTQSQSTWADETTQNDESTTDFESSTTTSEQQQRGYLQNVRAYEAQKVLREGIEEASSEEDEDDHGEEYSESEEEESTYNEEGTYDEEERYDDEEGTYDDEETSDEEEGTYDEEETYEDTASYDDEYEAQHGRSAMQSGEEETYDEPEDSGDGKRQMPGPIYERVEALQGWDSNLRDMLAKLHPKRKQSRPIVAMDADPFTSKKCKATETSHKIVHGFEALLKAFLQLSNELELCRILGSSKISKAISESALTSVLSYAPMLEQVFSQLNPILEHYLFEEAPSEQEEELLERAELLLRLQSEVVLRVVEKQEYTLRSETCFVTLVELLDRTATEIVGDYERRPVPDYQLPNKLCRTWRVAGHSEKLEPSFFTAQDMKLFRQMCFEVLVSTDHWCPNKKDLGIVCGVNPPLLSSTTPPKDVYGDEFAPVPAMAMEVLDKIQGEPLMRIRTMASILRRILPTEAVTDARVLSEFYDRKDLSSHLGATGTNNIVAISSVPEVWNDPTSVGMSGVGKSTMAAVVSSHADVRRHYSDGIVWVSVGMQEMNYDRYCQCLRELCSQLVFCETIPLLPELVRNPGEALSTRQRREYGFMLCARDIIAELLQGRKALIILDHVEYKSDLKWFQFSGNASSLSTPVAGTTSGHAASPGSGPATYGTMVITRCRDLLPAADTVEVDLLEESEAIRLLVTESGQDPDHVMAESKEARSVVRVCSNHPLAVKSVGRWLSLKQATSGVITSVEEIHEEVANAISQIVQKGHAKKANDTLYEILSMAFSPAVNGKPTLVIKFCFASFVKVFCRPEHHSLFSPLEVQPVIPMALAELLFETLLELEEEKLFQEGSLFYSQRREATMLIPEALSALGVVKVISSSVDDLSYDDTTQQSSLYSRDMTHESSRSDSIDSLFLQIMHSSQQSYGEYLLTEEEDLKELTKNAERRWNREFVTAYMATWKTWDVETADASRDYAVEMIVSHMIRAEMYEEASKLLTDKDFVNARVQTLGRENATRQHITDCEALYEVLKDKADRAHRKKHPRALMERSYKALGNLLIVEEGGSEAEEVRALFVETGRAQFEIGLSLAEKRSWNSAITHWETSQELLVSSLGIVEFVAAILLNTGMAFAEINEYEKALSSLKRCLRIRGAVHGEKHILYAQTIQKIGDVFLGMSDYNEAMDSYNWALDVMHSEPDYHRVDIGDILENMGNIHYSKGQVPEALLCYQDALRSKKVELGNDHPELAATYQHIGNCLSDQGEAEEAIAHFEEAIRLRKLDPIGGEEQDADILSIEGVLNNLHGRQEQGLHCYEKCLEILVTQVPHKKEKIAALLHLIGCVYLMNGEHKKAMRLFEESLQARQKILGFVHLDVASTLFNMAFLHQMRNRLGKALKCLEEALKIRQLRLPDSEKVALTHEKIGTLAKAVGKSKKAEAAFQEALRIRKLIHGDDHEAVAAVLHEIGDLMDDLGYYDEAMRNYIAALDIRRKRLGPDHEDVASTLYSMGFTLHNQEQPERALQCFEEALNIRRVRLGEDAKEVGDTLNMMGFLQAKRGEMDDALSLLWDALRIRKLQEDLVKVCETLKNIGNVHREKREHELAAECYEECLRIRRAELGDDHEKVADALVAIGNVRSDMEETDEAMQAYKEALTIRTLVHGRNDEKVAAVLQYMGTMEFRSGDFDSAQRYLDEFVRIRRENQAERDGEFVNVLFMMGNIHKIEGRDAEARECWSEAYQVFQELGLAEENPQLAKVMDSLLQGDALYDDGFGGASDSKKRGFLNRIMETLRE